MDHVNGCNAHEYSSIRRNIMWHFKILTDFDFLLPPTHWKSFNSNVHAERSQKRTKLFCVPFCLSPFEDFYLSKFPLGSWVLPSVFSTQFCSRSFRRFSHCVPEILGKDVEQLRNGCDAERFRVLLPGDENAADCFGCFLLSQLFLCRGGAKTDKGFFVQVYVIY